MQIMPVIADLEPAEIDQVSGGIFNPPDDAVPVPGKPGMYMIHGVPIYLLDLDAGQIN